MVAGTAGSFLAPEGDGREPLGFFGSTAPLLMVVLRGRVCTSGLAVRQAEQVIRTLPWVKVSIAALQKRALTHMGAELTQKTSSSGWQGQRSPIGARAVR